MNKIEKALRIAVEAHKGQIRKGDGSPYIVHPLMVAFKLQKYNFPDEVIAAALAHDVLEDTDYPEKKLREELGDEVLEIVKAVTNDDSLEWEEKKKQYIETVRKGPEGAKAVCIADKIHNLESLLAAYKEQGPDLFNKFNRGRTEKIWFETEVLKMAKETWQHPLVDEYEKLIKILKKETKEPKPSNLPKTIKEKEKVKDLNQDNPIKGLHVYVVDTFQSEQDKKDHIEHEDYEVYLVNNSDFDIEKVEMLVGGFTYQEEGTLETSKQLINLGKLESKGKILLEGLDMGMLDFVNWYNLDLFLADGKCLKIWFDFNYYNLVRDNLEIAPVINIEAYPIKFRLRKDELFVEDTAKTINMDGQFVKSQKELGDKKKKYAVYWAESKYSAITSDIEKEERVLVGKYDSRKEAEEVAKNYLEKNNDDPFDPISVWVSEED